MGWQFVEGLCLSRIREKEVNLGRRVFLAGMGAAIGGAALFLRRPHVTAEAAKDGAGGGDDHPILRLGPASGEGEDCARGEVGSGVEEGVDAWRV